MPTTKAAFDGRMPIADLMAVTIQQQGVGAAVAQYRTLHATESAIYNFDEDGVNSLGYKYLRDER